MKKVLGIGLMAMALAFVSASKTEAAVLTGEFHVCQGGTCMNFPGDAFGGAAGVTVGDYLVRGSGSYLENATLGRTSQTNIAITRIGNSSADPLEVWWTVQNYEMPAGPQFVMSTSASASKTGAVGALVSYSAWYSAANANGPLYPAAGAVLGGSGSCVLADNPGDATGESSCAGTTPKVGVGASSPLYSLISKTTFNIAQGNTSLFESTGSASVSAVPEPGTMMLFGTGLVGMATVLRRRFAKK